MRGGMEPLRREICYAQLEGDVVSVHKPVASSAERLCTMSRMCRGYERPQLLHYAAGRGRWSVWLSTCYWRLYLHWPLLLDYAGKTGDVGRATIQAELCIR